MALVDKSQLKLWQEKAHTLLNRSLDRHVRLAVTGLSRSGKTAFITALVNQLEQAGLGARLPQWNVLQSGRLLGVRRVPQRHHHIPTFRYEANMEALLGDPPAWPHPTRSVSEIRLELRFHTRHPLLRHLSREPSTLYLDIVDYPGEWLLDLPLLELSYAEWSQQVRQQLTRPALQALAQPWLSQGAALDGGQPFDEETVAELASRYTRYLHDCKEQLGLHLIQPGRFVLPGEYAGAPLLQFVPWVWTPPDRPVPAESLYAMLEERYEHYKHHLVRGFYQEHFAWFDRQIVLVDCLQPLQDGEGAFQDLEQTLAQLMQSFSYGNSRWWRRLFAPRIDRLLFAATKADHVTPDQHANLLGLLRQLVQRAQGLARFEGIRIECLALAAVRASEFHQVSYQGQPLTVLQGTDLAGEPVALFPGELPAGWPEADFWASPQLAPVTLRPRSLRREQAIAHIRMDQALEFLLGDKLS